jgi:hypothetical protein
MENCHNFTLNEAAKETGRSKGTISKALNNGKVSYISKTKSGYQIEPAELFRVFPLKQDKSRNQVHLETQKETTNAFDIVPLLLPVSFAASFKVKLWQFSMVFSIGSHYWFYSIHYNIT